MIPGVGPIISALVTWGSTAGANAKQMWKEGEGEVSADKAIGYGTLSGAIEGAVNYFGNRLFDAGTLKGAGNRVVAQMAETSGGQALLNTFGATITDTGMELFTTILKDEIKTWYNPKAEKMSEEELQKMIYTSLVANLVINGMQNFVAYQKGLVAETGPSEAEERAMMRSMAGEELEAEVPRSRPQAEEAEMMGTMEENIRGRAEAEASGRRMGDQELSPTGKMESADVQERELMGEFEKNIEIEGGQMKLSAEASGADGVKQGLQWEKDSQKEFAEILENETSLGEYSGYNDTINTGIQSVDNDIIHNAGAKKIIHRDGRVEVIGEGEIAEVVDKRPYLDPKHRPSYRKGVPEKVFERARMRDGVVKDPLVGTIIEWEPGQPRNGVWDMGHIPEQKYSKVHQEYLEGKMTPKEFRDWYNNPDHYRPELPSTNRSHQLE